MYLIPFSYEIKGSDAGRASAYELSDPSSLQQMGNSLVRNSLVVNSRNLFYSSATSIYSKYFLMNEEITEVDTSGLYTNLIERKG